MKFRNFIYLYAVLVILGIFLNNQVTAQSLTYVQTDVVKVAGVTTESQVDNLNATEKQTSIVYLDGLGRPIQSVAVKATPLGFDLIQPISYDNLGRQDKQYLPYSDQGNSGQYRSNAIGSGGAQTTYYSDGVDDKIAHDAEPYSQQLFDNSPLQRVLRQGGVGAGFQPLTGLHYKQLVYRYNVSGDNVIEFGNDGSKYGNYPVNVLSVNEMTDEGGANVKIFKNAAGQTILKRQLANSIINGVNVTYFDTYYVYNLAGQIIYVIPPKATSLLLANTTYTLATTAVNNLLFKYSYDDRARLTGKTVPGSGSINFIYDPLDRVVLLQNAKLKLSNKWNYIKYDNKGNAILQGLYTNTTYTTPQTMQTYVDGLDYSVNWCESRFNNSTNGYYTNNSFPTTSTELLAFIYYDDYDLNQDGSGDYIYTAQGLDGQASAAATSLRGKLTIVRQRSLGTGLSNVILTNAIFYDKFGQVIQVKSSNQLNSTANSSRSTSYSFTGAPIQSKRIVTVINGTTQTTSVLTSFTYDQMSRPVEITQRYNNAADYVKIANYSYNELGQIIDKKLHSPNASANWLQSVDFRFNIRGQLSSINNSKLSNDGVMNDDANDVFGMEMLYHNSDSNIGNTASFTGHISAVKWMSLNASGSKSYERSFKYSYDLLGRYTASNYAERTTTGTGAFNNNIGGFDEYGINYDENGNILTLKRNSSSQGTNANTEVDNLTYNYDSNNANLLQKVTDGSGTNYTGYGFKNIKASTGNYAYEAATGNLVTDPFKGLVLTYNDLNRTDKITVDAAAGKYLQYTYDAGGKLLRKQMFVNNTLQNTTDYIDGFVYNTVGTTTTLAYFSMPEGRVRNTAGVLINEYTISDQQGNARVTFDNSGAGGIAKVIQENSFYGFGMQLANSPVAVSTTPKKEIYNGGSELQDDFADLPNYYQTFYRNYDAGIGRFVSVDPKAEATESMSIYQFANNNPIMFNDPLGDMAAKTVNEIVQYILDHSSGSGGAYNANTGNYTIFANDSEAFNYSSFFVWGGGGGSGGGGSGGVTGGPSSYSDAAKAFNNNPNKTGPNVLETYTPLREVTIQETKSNPNWLPDRLNEANNKSYPFTYIDRDQNQYLDYTLWQASSVLKSELYTKISSAVVTGTDALAVSISKAQVINKVLQGVKIESTAFKAFTHSGTVIGAIAGGIPAIVSIKNDGLNMRNGTAAGLAILGVAAEFTGLGEAWDGTVGLGIAGASLIFDIYDATHPTKNN